MYMMKDGINEEMSLFGVNLKLYDVFLYGHKRVVMFRSQHKTNSY